MSYMNEKMWSYFLSFLLFPSWLQLQLRALTHCALSLYPHCVLWVLPNSCPFYETLEYD